MVRLQSAIATRLQTVRNSLQVKVQTAIDAVSHASRRAKFVFGSAFALAFLIAPAAALMLSGSPSKSLNNADTSGSDPGTASPTDGQASSQTPAATNDNSDTSGGSSTSVNVTNDTTTVTVNGQTVVGPTTAPVSKTINSNGTQTIVNVQSNSSGSGQVNSTTNKNVHVFTHSTTNTKTESSP